MQRIHLAAVCLITALSAGCGPGPTPTPEPTSTPEPTPTATSEHPAPRNDCESAVADYVNSYENVGSVPDGFYLAIFQNCTPQEFAEAIPRYVVRRRLENEVEPFT